MAKKFLFWIEEEGQTKDDADLFEAMQIGASDDLTWAAEQYAEYYHENCDGWESSWPLEFCVADESGKFLGRVDVERESRPIFSGRVVNETAPGD